MIVARWLGFGVPRAPERVLDRLPQILSEQSHSNWSDKVSCAQEQVDFRDHSAGTAYRNWEVAQFKWSERIGKFRIHRFEMRVKCEDLLIASILRLQVCLRWRQEVIDVAV